MAGNSREIALLTNPASGTGRATRTAGMVLHRLQDSGLEVLVPDE